MTRDKYFDLVQIDINEPTTLIDELEYELFLTRKCLAGQHRSRSGCDPDHDLVVHYVAHIRNLRTALAALYQS